MASKFIVGSSPANQQKNYSTAGFFIKIDKKLQTIVLFIPVWKLTSGIYNSIFKPLGKNNDNVCVKIKGANFQFGNNRL
jgi:hypothetical protein